MLIFINFAPKFLANVMSAKLTIICILLCPAALYSQNSTDSSYYKSSLSNAIEWYHHANPDQAAIYSAPQYVRFPYPIKQGQAFYNMDKLEMGSLVYDNVLYDSVQLMHDEVRDQLIISDFHHLTLLLLYSKKVSWFSIYGQPFVRLEKNESEGVPDNLGFCQLLYDGSTKVYKKEVKKINSRAENSEGLSRYISSETYYYINYNHKFHEVTNSKSLLEAFGTRKKDLNQYLRSNRLKFKKNKDSVIVRAAAFIDQSKK